MTISVSQVDPAVDRLVILDRSDAGGRRVVADIDSGLTRRPRKRYQVRVIKRADGKTTSVTRSRSKKKQSRSLRPVEKMTRKAARRTVRFMQDYLYLHDRSNKKKKNGWLRQGVTNIRKAARRSAD